MAMLTLAVLTMAMLTMAMLTMTVLTMYLGCQVRHNGKPPEGDEGDEEEAAEP